MGRLVASALAIGPKGVCADVLHLDLFGALIILGGRWWVLFIGAP